MQQTAEREQEEHSVVAKPRRVKILTLGDTLVGKSCLIKRYCEGKFVQKYISTIGIDYGVRRVKTASSDLRLNFFDTGGVQKYGDIRAEFVKDAQIVLLVFDVSSKSSFDSLRHWVAELDACSNAAPGLQQRLLVGNKADLQRTVSKDTARAWADKHNMPYFEVSAMSGNGVPPLFDYVCSLADGSG